ncbi:hypothetical protein K435DRAFT_801945 [Dendrothele bispora CBS 962.96]|uniref:Uncharacterized protein n=1 Tax=Dendrothele bispora (strain CBS 962.96) TaxID=1314807 RepID=A0A4S8LP17_DENBC|nr:hypothetical protein K435DRAFT_801945 [Dendrothele bispora CBS 962.96]
MSMIVLPSSMPLSVNIRNPIREETKKRVEWYERVAKERNKKGVFRNNSKRKYELVLANMRHYERANEPRTAIENGLAEQVEGKTARNDVRVIGPTSKSDYDFEWHQRQNDQMPGKLFLK